MKKNKVKNKIMALVITLAMLLQCLPLMALGALQDGTAPVGQWTFDEGKGTTAADTSGNDNHGTMAGPTWTDGMVGKALSFSGNGCVEILHHASLSPRNALTIEAWVNPSTNMNWRKVISKSVGSNTDYSIFQGAENNLAFSIKMGSIARTAYAPANSVPLGEWTYAVGTYDGCRMKLYLNGTLVKTINISGQINAHNEPLRIGGEKRGAYFEGKIDEVKIYNEALSAAEILSRYEAVINPVEVGTCIGQWTFDEGKGTTAADTSGNDNHGTMAGPTWTDGMVGKALSFSGNGCVEIPHHASLNPRNALTIEAWVNPSTNMNWRKVISKSVGSNTDYSIFQGAENNLAFSIKMGSIARTAYAPANSVPLGEWSYVVGTYDGCRMKLYLNGTLVKTINISGQINAHNEPLRIGGEKQGAYFEGKIDEVSIYNRALTAEEIASRYEVGNQLTVPEAPKNLTIEKANDGFKLSWDKVENATGYVLLRSIDQDIFETIADSMTTATYTDGDLNLYGVYAYKVIALNQFGESDDSNVVYGYVGEFGNGVVDIENIDTDGDLLADWFEEVIGSDPEIKDTDGDKLPDGYEYNTLLTNPTVVDTNENGIQDGQEDFDQDGLVNLEEYLIQSNPWDSDSDADGLTDNEEVKLHNTDPNSEDTDSDNFYDIDEITYGTNPLNPDTNGNGVKDGEEKYVVTKSVPATEADPNVVPTIKIEMSGSEMNALQIFKVDERDLFLNDAVPGYIGSGYEFESTESFNSATLTFSFNPELLENPDFEPAIYFVDTENQEMVLIENQDVDLFNCTVSAEIQHFSKYILLNKTDFDKVWEKEIKLPSTDGGTNKSLAIALVIDSSGSMYSNDYQGIRKTAAKKFVEKLREIDRAAIIDFDSTAKLFSELTSDKIALCAAIDSIDNSGGTSLTAGIQMALEQFPDSLSEQNLAKYIIMLTDGDGVYNSNLTQQAIDKNIVIYTIGLGSSVNTSLLSSIATQTGGKYYSASVAEELDEIFEETAEETIDFVKDSDADGIPDYYEINLDRLFNGAPISLDPHNPDVDNDGLKDGEEVRVTVESDGRLVYFKVNSHPNAIDSDSDEIPDNVDLAPMVTFKTPVILLHGRTDNNDDCFGVKTNIEKGDNLHYDSEYPKDGEYEYTNPDSQRIEDGWMFLGLHLEKNGYEKNANLFSFNYPNVDMVQFNGKRLQGYINNLVNLAKSGTDKNFKVDRVFKTEEDLENNKYQFDLVGHSMGGLVARYYIENLEKPEGRTPVRKLITLNTPHFGSGFADIGSAVVFSPFSFPCDQDLKPTSRLFTGEKDNFIPIGEEEKYMLRNQSPRLNGNSNVDTLYYAIGGYDVGGDGEGWVKGEMKNIPLELRNTNFIFDFERKTGTKKEFIESLRKGCEKVNSEIKLNLGLCDGDNVVDFMSQFGVCFVRGKEAQTVNFHKNSLNVDTKPGHNCISHHFHGINQKTKNVREKVLEYLSE